MDKKEIALLQLESDNDSICQSIRSSKKCYLCPYLRRLQANQGRIRILMDYGHKPKNTTLTTFKIKKYGAGTRRATKENRRVKKFSYKTFK